MAGSKDEIPDLLPGGGRGVVGASSSVVGGGAAKGAPQPPAPLRPPVASPAPDIDEFEFDVLGVTSQRSQEIVQEFLGGRSESKSAARPPSVGLSLDYSASRRAAPSGRASSPELELGGAFDGAAGERSLELTEEAEEVVSRRSSYPPDARLGSEPPSRRGSIPPSSLPELRVSAATRSVRSSVPPIAPGAANVGALPPSGAASPSVSGVGELDLFDFDAEMGIAPAKDFAVAVALPAADEVGYPTGETPRTEDFSFETTAIEEASGFGPRPKSALGAPLYALRVTVGSKQLRRAFEERRSALAMCEDARDRALAELAERFRQELSKENRFLALYGEVRRFEELEAERERTLAQTSSAGANDVSALDARIEEARRVRLLTESKRDEQARVVTEAGRVVQRAQSQRKRLEIEMRNIERLALERVPGGAQMPPDLALRYLPVQREHELALEALRRAEEQNKALQGRLRSLEEDARRALGDEQRVVAEREGFLLTHSGDVHEYAKLLDEARRGRTSELARAARGILGLRGEIQVGEEIRRGLFVHEDAVTRAARELALVERALASADGRAVARGKTLAVVLAAALFALLLVGLTLR